MLGLRLAPSHATPVRRDPGPDTEVWRDGHGQVAAFGGRSDSRVWVQVPGIGHFVIGVGGGLVDAFAEDGVRNEHVEDAFRRIVLPLVLQARGDEVLHASASLTPGGVIAFCGVSGTGKSTLAYAFSRRGYPVFADDALVVRFSEGIEAVSVPFRVSLREPAAGFLGATPGLHETEAVSERAPLRALVVLERSAERGHRVERLSAADAFTAVLEHAYCFTLAEPKRTRAMVAAYLDLVSKVPVLRLTFAPSLPALPTVANELLEAAARPAA